MPFVMTFAPTQGQHDDEDSDADFEQMDVRLSLMTLLRADKIKVIEFTDPEELSCCRLAQLSDMQLHMLCFIVSPALCTKDAKSLGVHTMAGFKRMMKASSVDNGIMRHLDKTKFGNLRELALASGWTQPPVATSLPSCRKRHEEPCSAEPGSASTKIRRRILSKRPPEQCM